MCGNAKLCSIPVQSHVAYQYCSVPGSCYFVRYILRARSKRTAKIYVCLHCLDGVLEILCTGTYSARGSDNNVMRRSSVAYQHIPRYYLLVPVALYSVLRTFYFVRYTLESMTRMTASTRGSPRCVPFLLTVARGSSDDTRRFPPENSPSLACSARAHEAHTHAMAVCRMQCTGD